MRRAAAAAEEEREALESRLRTKAFVAAREAEALGGFLGAWCWCEEALRRPNMVGEGASTAVATASPWRSKGT